MRVVALSDALGAEVVDLDVRGDLTDGQIAAIDRALCEHGVLLFREQPMEAEELVRFSAHFGPLQEHVQKAYHHPEIPEVVMMTNQKPDGSFDETGARRGSIEDINRGWHSDLAYDTEPAKATLLHALEIPSRGGNTCFINTRKAYQTLEPELKQRIGHLSARFQYGGHTKNKELAIAARSLDAKAQKSAAADHPVVSIHPVSGDPALYVSPLLTTFIHDLPEDASEMLLDSLFQAMADPALQWEHRWRVGDTLMWDNRGGTHHSGRLDYPRGEARRFMRTTVRGGPIMGLGSMPHDVRAG
jgi:taurine dioxygenase